MTTTIRISTTLPGEARRKPGLAGALGATYTDAGPTTEVEIESDEPTTPSESAGYVQEVIGDAVAAFRYAAYGELSGEIGWLDEAAAFADATEGSKGEPEVPQGGADAAAPRTLATAAATMPASASIAVDAQVTRRVVAGKVTLIVTLTNTSSDPVQASILTDYGRADDVLVAPGVTHTSAFNTRLANLSPGAVKVTAYRVVDYTALDASF